MSEEKSQLQWGTFVALMTAVSIALAVAVLAFVVALSRNASAPTMAEENAIAAQAAPAPAAAEPARTAPSRTVSRKTAPSRPVAARPLASYGPAPGSSPPIAGLAVIPAGTRFEAVLNQRLSTETNQVGDAFEAVLTRPVSVAGETVLEEGTLLAGRIIDLERPGRVSGKARMTLVLNAVSGGEEGVSIQTASLSFEGEATKAEDAAKVGIGAGAGAVLGGILGGKEGAVRGATIGGAAGAGQVVATRGKDLVLPPEHRMTFVLSRNAAVAR